MLAPSGTHSPAQLARLKTAFDVLRRQLGAEIVACLREDSRLREVMINAPDCVYVETVVDGQARMLKQPKVRYTEDTARSIIRGIAAIAGGNPDDPIIDARLPGLRIVAISPQVAVRGSCVVIRKHATVPFQLGDYLASGSFLSGTRSTDLDASREYLRAAENRRGAFGFKLIEHIISSRSNVLISGATGSAKTSFMSAMIAAVPAGERLVTIEDPAEMVLPHDNRVSLEVNGKLGVTARRLIKTALRMRPDRLFVGEVRGEEAYDLIDGMNTGHPGSMCTVHADSPLLALYRIESLVRANVAAQTIPLRELRKLVARTFRFVIGCEKTATGVGPTRIIYVHPQLDPNDEYVCDVAFSRYVEDNAHPASALAGSLAFSTT